MTAELAIDYAWSHPSPSAIKAAGYSGVIRYLSHDVDRPGHQGKNLTIPERDALHAAGLWILLVWEDAANAALGGATTGHAHGIVAAQQAAALGYPTTLPLFHAVDFDAQPAQMAAVLAYGDAFAQHWPTGPYGGRAVIDASRAAWRWQASAWSRGVVSQSAALFQRLAPTTALKGSFDENVVLRTDLPVWRPPGAPIPIPADPVSNPLPDPKEHAVLLFQDTTGIYFLTGAGTVHVPTVPDVGALQKAGVPLVPVSDSFGASLRGTT